MVVLDMPPPSNIKEVQRLTGRIAALSRFVSKASDKCQPFFQVLKKAFRWDAHCEEAFSALKAYLSSPPIMVSPYEEELLTLYLVVSDFSTSVTPILKHISFKPFQICESVFVHYGRPINI